jgi:hypothetical protein
MADSQNGWPLAGRDDQDRTGVAGVDFPNGVLRGDVATVLLHVARRFHEEVEPLHPGWCWGWEVKKINGTDTFSNHASGTALDLNAPDHPVGPAGTFTDRQVARIRRILDDCDGVVRWGGDYSGDKDEMHFEIVKGRAAVAALADKITQEEIMTPEHFLDLLSDDRVAARMKQLAGQGVHNQKLGASDETIGQDLQSDDDRLAARFDRIDRRLAAIENKLPAH